MQRNQISTRKSVKFSSKRRRNNNQKQTRRGLARQRGTILVERENDEVSISFLNSPFIGLPDVFKLKLRYYENSYHFDLGTTDTLLQQSLSINDPYDPVAAIGGKSANLFQQIGSLYRFCRVNAVNVKITYQDVSTANTCPVQFALVLNSEGVSYADMDDVISLPNSRRRVSLLTQDRIGTTRTLTGRFYPKDAFYMSQQQWDNLPPGSPEDVTNVGGFASPTSLAILDIIYAKIDQANTTAVANFGSVTIDFEVTFKFRIPFPE
jgi:hypothetical protein